MTHAPTLPQFLQSSQIANCRCKKPCGPGPYLLKLLNSDLATVRLLLGLALSVVVRGIPEDALRPLLLPRAHPGDTQSEPPRVLSLGSCLCLVLCYGAPLGRCRGRSPALSTWQRVQNGTTEKNSVHGGTLVPSALVVKFA